MYKKIALVFSCICLLNHFAGAENTEICKIAKDSVKAKIKRGELAFYIPSKTNPNLYNYIIITKNYYQKTPVRISPSSKDSSFLTTNKFASDNYLSRTDKSHPLDTSNEFKKCFNQAFQSKLDTTYKCDFFRKVDSVLMAYDKTGRGYSSVDFQGGAGGLQKYLDKNITLPKDITLSDTGKVIRVYYSFFVDEAGAISEVQLIKSNCKACEEIISEAVHKLPAFIPAKDAGKPKKVKYIMPYIKMLVAPKTKG